MQASTVGATRGQAARLRVSALAIAVSTVVVAAPLRAADNSWIGSATGNWNVAANWSGGVPQPGDHVLIDAGNVTNTTVTLDTPASVSTLSISSGDRLNIAASTSLSITGSNWSNAGALAIQASGSLQLASGTVQNSGVLSTVSNSTMRLNAGTFTLAGAGTLSMNGGAIGGPGRLVNSAGHTIEGRGVVGLGSPGAINHGLIRATGIEQTMILASRSDASFINTGTIETGVFTYVNLEGALGGVFDNTGGVMFTNHGRFQFNEATIVGGILRAVDLGEFFVPGGNSRGTVRDVRNEATITAYNSGAITMLGTIDNVGLVRIDSQGLATSLVIGSSTTTFAGGGRISLAGDARIGGSGTLDNQGNTIGGARNFAVGLTPNIGSNGLTIINRAAGRIESNNTLTTVDPGAGGLTNFGTLSAISGGNLLLSDNGPGAFTNSGTVEAIGAGSIVNVPDPGVLTNVAGNTLTGGTWVVENGGRIALGGASIATNRANVRLRGTGTSSDFSAIAALSRNEGVLAIEAGRDASTSSALTNGGTIQIGAGGADYSITGAFTQEAAGNLEMTLGGTGTESFGQLFAQSVNLDGKLYVSLANAFVPALNASFSVLNAPIVNGTFFELIAPPLPGGRYFTVQYQTNAVILRVAVPEPAMSAGVLMLAGALGHHRNTRRRKRLRRSSARV